MMLKRESLKALMSGRSFSSMAYSMDHRPDNIYNGVFPISVTPFRNDAKESIDLKSFERSICFLRKSGASGVTITGVLGESNRLTDNERALLIKVARQTIDDDIQNGGHNKFHLCVGTSHSGTAAAVALSEMAMELGADGIMVSPQRDGNGPPPTLDSILELYQRIQQACSNRLPIILQDHPTSTGVNLTLEGIAEILSETPSIRSIKLESMPTAPRIVSLRQSSDFVKSQCTILTGLGALYAGFDMDQGIDGFMTGFAFPELLVQIYNLTQQQRLQEARDLYHAYLPLLILESQPGVGLAVRKEIYKRRGLIHSSHVRHPGISISCAMEEILTKELDRVFFQKGVDIASLINP